MLDKYLEAAYEREQRTDTRNQMAEAFKALPAEELAKIASGEVKLALYDNDDWLKKFQGTDLYDEALALEEECLQLDIQDQQRRMAEKGRNDDIWDAKDAIRLKKRMLELELRKEQMGDYSEEPELEEEPEPMAEEPEPEEEEPEAELEEPEAEEVPVEDKAAMVNPTGIKPGQFTKKKKKKGKKAPPFGRGGGRGPGKKPDGTGPRGEGPGTGLGLGPCGGEGGAKPKKGKKTKESCGMKTASAEDIAGMRMDMLIKQAQSDPVGGVAGGALGGLSGAALGGLGAGALGALAGKRIAPETLINIAKGGVGLGGLSGAYVGAKKGMEPSKEAMLALPLGAGAGALQAPEGEAVEGLIRGGAGAGLGSMLGAPAGALAGAGAGGLAGLALRNPEAAAALMTLGGGLGALGGGVGGGLLGYQKAMRPLKEKKREQKREAKEGEKTSAAFQVADAWGREMAQMQKEAMVEDMVKEALPQALGRLRNGETDVERTTFEKIASGADFDDLTELEKTALLGAMGAGLKGAKEFLGRTWKSVMPKARQAFTKSREGGQGIMASLGAGAEQFAPAWRTGVRKAGRWMKKNPAGTLGIAGTAVAAPAIMAGGAGHLVGSS